MRSARFPSPASLPAKCGSEELDAGRNAFLDRDLRHICGGLDSKHGDAEGQKVLKQIAIITGEFDGKAVRLKLEPLCNHCAIGFCMSHP